MADLILVSWRDIPTQVIAKAGRRSEKRELAPRFMIAVDAAAMRGGAKDSDAYLEGWRRVVVRACGEDLAGEAKAAAEALEKEYDEEHLKRLIAGGGFKSDAGRS